MKFHSVAIICALATPAVDGFGVVRNHLSFTTSSSSVLRAKAPVYDFGDLETKLLSPPSPAPTVVEEKNIKSNASKATPAPEAKVAEKPQKQQKKTKDPKPTPVETPKSVSVATAPIEPKKVEVVVPKPAPTPAPTPIEKPKPVAQTKSVTKDSNAVPAGVALGAAPLVVAPIVALSAVRSTLAKTKARRDEIAREIAEFEAKEAARLAKKKAEVDGGTLGKAIVSNLTESTSLYVLLYPCIVQDSHLFFQRFKGSAWRSSRCHWSDHHCSFWQHELSRSSQVRTCSSQGQGRKGCQKRSVSLKG